MELSQTSQKTPSLVASPARVEVPFVQVIIGDYTFGVQGQVRLGSKKTTGFPNYIQSLSVRKINGQVNNYTLILRYPVTQNDDPNFFEKVFSKVSRTRKIVFSYGDLAVPTQIYREEEAMITDVTSDFGLSQTFDAVITYTVQAVSTAMLGKAAALPFFQQEPQQPSKVIWEMLRNPETGLQDLFPGMRDEAKVRDLGLIPSNDQQVKLESFSSITPLEYLNYLVSCMVPNDSPLTGISKGGVYLLTIHDDNESLGGSYFKIVQSTQGLDRPEAYELDIGYPSGSKTTQNAVISFRVQNNQTYSILYEYGNRNSEGSSPFVSRINSKGKEQWAYAPISSSQNSQGLTRSNDISY